MRILSIILFLISSFALKASEDMIDWREDRELLESYHSDLSKGHIDGAIIKIISWCTTKYQQEMNKKPINNERIKQLASDIKEASMNLEFIAVNNTAFKIIISDSNTFGSCLGCFEMLFKIEAIRDGVGDKYERFIDAYITSWKATRKLLNQKNKPKTKVENKSQ